VAIKHLQLTDELQEQASLYASGAMTESERREYIRHLEDDGCAVCRREAEEFQAVAGMMGLGADPMTPSPSVKTHLMAPLTPPVKEKSRGWLVWLAAMEAVAASVLLFMVFRDNTELRNATEALRTRVAELESRLQEQQLLMATFTSSDVQVTNLAGQGANASARARLFWDQPRRRWLVYVNNLPPTPATQSYQLWFVPKTGNPVSASVFNTQPDGSAVVDATVPTDIDLMAAAVTTEPAGGLPQPSGPFALLGALN
jgi:anti-sigma-K factor RskA